ncbi:hypothetical protein [Stieleria marina]|uniref:Uncharacterized protein n=1 Tax=Stieleria marina TaxID=1930275 RepID=A0A517NUI1_9BACT|nr:hypothetical protein K239x_27790 [Planctomycetes bacterium K23_9]
MGTPDDDKILILVTDDRIRFFINGDSVGRIREDDLPNNPAVNEEISLPNPLKIYISGGEGNDSISLLIEESDESPLDLHDRAVFLLYGDDGDDKLISAGIDQVGFCGGKGADVLIGDGAHSQYAVCDLQIQDLETFEPLSSPDLSRDIIFPGNEGSTVFRNYYLQFDAVSHSSSTLVNFDKTPRKLPSVPTIVSREKANTTIYEPDPIVFDSILLDQDYVINDSGCTVMDVYFSEDGSTMSHSIVD